MVEVAGRQWLSYNGVQYLMQKQTIDPFWARVALINLEELKTL